jgi:iron complex outermembrane receptor protein
MRLPCLTSTVLAALIGVPALTPQTALAQSAQPGAVYTLDAITVTAEGAGSLADTLRERFDQAPGATAVVGAEEIKPIPAPTFAEAMIGVPGVVVQEFFGGFDQPRIQIRGSGMQQSPTERGLLVLQNGMPVNRADGSYIAGLAAPGTAEAIEIWRGPSAHRLGASVLGGAINFISPTATSAPGSQLSFGAGSFGRFSAAGQTALQGERANGLIQFEWDQSDGYRDENDESRRGLISGNAEILHGDGITTQVFLSYTDLEFDIPGPLPKDELKSDPERVYPGPTVVMGRVTNPGPNVLRDRPDRESSQLLLGARTTVDRTEHLYDLGFSLTKTDDSFLFPISSAERVTDGYDGTLSARYAFRPDQVAGLPLVEGTLIFSIGEADRTNYHNTDGKRGPQFGKSDLSARTLSPYLGANLPLNDQLFLSPSVGYTWANRKNDDRWRAATRPTVGYSPMMPNRRLPDGTVPARDSSYDRDYDGWTGALALTWKPVPSQTAWISVAHSFEPPTHDDLIAPINGTPFSGPGRPAPPRPSSNAEMFTTPDLEAQTAETVEIGWKGSRRGFGWDATLYHSWIDNEILSLRDASASPRASVNADNTLHTGFELGLNGRFQDALRGRLAWTWQDFRFDNDPVRGDNRLGGSIRNLITAAVEWTPLDQLRILPTLRWVPDKTPVDNMNTLYADPYAVVDLSVDWAISKQVSLQAEATNLFDETYAASTVVVDQAQPGQAAFIPGVGRAFYLGGRVQF